jgi:hypothetical protein
MHFGEAIQAMRDGHLVQRAGWNGKGMHLYLTVAAGTSAAVAMAAAAMVAVAVETSDER